MAVEVQHGTLFDDPAIVQKIDRITLVDEDRTIAVRRIERRALSELAESRELEALRPAA